MRRMLSQWTHQSAATLVGDVERPRILQQPGSKRAAGRLVMLGMAMVIALSLLKWSSMQQPPVRIKRQWVSVQSLEEQVRFMNESAAKLADGAMHCPCVNRPTPYADQQVFIFYVITPDPKIQGAYRREFNPEQGVEFNLGTTFGAPYSFDLCYKVIPLDAPSVNYMLLSRSCRSLEESIGGYLTVQKDADAFLNPVRFLKRASTGLLDIIITAENARIPQILLGTPTASTVDRLLGYVNLMWTNMLEVGHAWNSWPPPKDADFWNQLQSSDSVNTFIEWAKLNVSVNRSVAFAMEVNWKMYYELCSPSYCDEFVQTSLGWSLFVGVAQVGGFFSLALVLLRALLWPIAQGLLGWSSEPARGLTIYSKNATLPVSSEQLPHLPQHIGSLQNKHLTHSNSWH